MEPEDEVLSVPLWEYVNFVEEGVPVNTNVPSKLLSFTPATVIELCLSLEYSGL
jgi:hypothetical protein